MVIILSKISNQQHSVRIQRLDKSQDKAILNSRSYLRHDLAHLAVETEVPLSKGYWGSVASGASLSGMEIRGPEIMLAEALSGPVQTLMRVEADIDKYEEVLERVLPELASDDLARRIWDKARRLQGHWKATNFGREMAIQWPEQP